MKMEKRNLAGVSETKTMSLQEQITILEEENTSINENCTLLTEKIEEMHRKIDKEKELKQELSQGKEESLSIFTREKEVLKAASKKLEEEKETLVAANEELSSQIKKAERQREKLEEMLSNITKENNNSLDELLQALANHLRHLHVWKNYFKTEGKEFEGDKISSHKEKDISDLDMFGQLGSILQSLEHEDLKIDVLKKERETKEAKEKENKEREQKKKDGEKKSKK